MKEYAKYELRLLKTERIYDDNKYMVRDSKSMYEYLTKICDMDKLPKEHFVEIALSAKGEIIGCSVISIGDISSAIIHPREVYQFAIMVNAAAIIVAHNHPSGNPDPSIEDIEITKRLKMCGEILGIKLLDHIVVGDNDYVSITKLLE